MKDSIETIKVIFGINDGKLALPRYNDDPYRRVNPNSQGNYWYISSLWLAQYYLDNNEIDKAIEILNWVKSHTLSTLIMGEQIDPDTDEVISPAPLTWSHAEYVSTLLDMMSNKGMNDG